MLYPLNDKLSKPNNPYKNLSFNFTYQNISHANFFNSICEIKISFVKLSFICEYSISCMKYMFDMFEEVDRPG